MTQALEFNEVVFIKLTDGTEMRASIFGSIGNYYIIYEHDSKPYGKTILRKDAVMWMREEEDEAIVKTRDVVRFSGDNVVGGKSDKRGSF